ncbi:MAG: hypothetical protein PWP01_667 [Methanosarcinales archaeon]|nr:MAG: hypothetical protein XD46_1006 [Euryarchaeota archaeon 55_53]MDN5295157.1 hypothetical protein [Methanosarcinales archaeon]
MHSPNSGGGWHARTRPCRVLELEAYDIALLELPRGTRIQPTRTAHARYGEGYLMVGRKSVLKGCKGAHHEPGKHASLLRVHRRDASSGGEWRPSPRGWWRRRSEGVSPAQQRSPLSTRDTASHQRRAAPEGREARRDASRREPSRCPHIYLRWS